MPQDYGAAQPIYDVVKKVYNKASDLLGDPTKSATPKKVDDEWHKQMVEKANESFRKGADTGTAKRVSPPSAKAPSKSPSQKRVTGARKTIPTKR